MLASRITLPQRSRSLAAKLAADAKGKPPAMPIHASGDVSAAMAKATKRVAADYAYPFIPHVPMEPINCTARVDGDKVEIWAPTQNPEPGRAAVAKLPLGVVTKAMMPFFVALFVVLLMVTYVPAISLWLPRAMGL